MSSFDEKIRLVEEIAANAWQPAVEQHLGGWRLRYSGGDSRRVNSVWPNRMPGTPPLDDCLDAVEEFYRRKGTPPRYQVSPAMQPADLTEHLDTRGFRPTAPTSVMTADLAGLLSLPISDDLSISSSAGLTETWFHLYTGASGYAEESLPIRRGILERIGPPACFVSISKDGIGCATGLGVAERGWLGVFCVVTAGAFRLQGMAIAVMQSLAVWGERQGVSQIYLQVMDDNPAARNLYLKLGFEQFYQYQYWELR